MIVIISLIIVLNFHQVIKTVNEVSTGSREPQWVASVRGKAVRLAYILVVMQEFHKQRLLITQRSLAIVTWHSIQNVCYNKKKQFVELFLCQC